MVIPNRGNSEESCFLPLTMRKLSGKDTLRDYDGTWEGHVYRYRSSLHQRYFERFVVEGKLGVNGTRPPKYSQKSTLRVSLEDSIHTNGGDAPIPVAPCHSRTSTRYRFDPKLGLTGEGVRILGGK